VVQEKGMNRLRLLGLVGDGDNILQSVVDRHDVLLGKLINEVGLGNILYGIESPDTDVTTHAASSSAHHVKYTDANAIAAVEGEATLVLTGAVSIADGKYLTLLTDGLTGGIKFGASGDVVLYRGAANTLYLGTGDSLKIVSGALDVIHISTEDDDHALEIDLNADGHGDVKALDIDYITGAIALGDDEGVALINIDGIAATGGEVFGFEVLATESSALLRGLKVGVGIDPVHHDSGVFVNPTTGTDNTTDAASGTSTAVDATSLTDSGASWGVDQWIGYTVTIPTSGGFGGTATVTSNTATVLSFSAWSSAGDPTDETSVYTVSNVPNMIDGAIGTTTAIFENQNEYILLGAAAPFEEIEAILTQFASGAGIKATFWYSTAGAHQFTQFSPVDGTNNFRNTGVIAWEAADLTSHAVNTDTGTYDIKIIRTRASLSTTPILGFAKTAATTEYVWDKDGNLNIFGLTVADKVGIGTASPQELLHVGEGTDVSDISATDLLVTRAGPSNLSVRDSTNGVETFLFASSVGGIIGTITNDPLNIKTNNTSAIFINASGNVSVAKSFSLSGDISPAQITADTHNYDPAGLSDASRIRVFTDASRNLTGIVPKSPDDGRILIVCNIGSNDLVLVAQSASSTDVNRFGMSGSITLVDGDAVTLQYDTTSNRWRVIGLSPGSAPTYASIAETNTGTEAAKSVTPDGLAGSNYGERTIDVLVSDPNGDAITTGDSKAKVQIPSTMNGWNLVEVESSLSTVSSSGIPTVQIRRSRRASATSRTNADMLSTKLTIDASEFDSVDAVAAAVINGSNDDVNTGDHIYIDIDVAGTGAKGLSVRMTFRLP